MRLPTIHWLGPTDFVTNRIVSLLAGVALRAQVNDPRAGGTAESNHRANGRDYAQRRDLVRGALTDTRGARGRARAVRDAARAGVEISQAVLAGIRPVHLDQIALFPDLDDGG